MSCVKNVKQAVGNRLTRTQAIEGKLSMIQRIVKDKTYRLTAILFTISFVICWLAWMRFFTAAALNPSPVRYVEFITDSGARAPFRQECAGPSFIHSDQVWRFCGYESGAGRTALESTAPHWGLVRFDLIKGEAVMRWPLPERPDAELLALARAANGDLLTVWGSPDPARAYRITREGAVPFDLPANLPPQVFGLADAGDRIELVAGDDQAAAIYAYTNGAWLDPRPVLPPESCGQQVFCSLQAARYDATGWTLVFAAVPTVIDDPARTVVDLLLRGESGAATPLPALDWSALAADQVTLDESGVVQRLGTLFDRAPGGVINWTINDAPLVLQADGWVKIDPPQAAASFYFSNYEILPTGLRWIPGLRFPLSGWQFDSWMTLKSANGGVALAQMHGKSGPTLTSSTVFLIGEGSQTSVLPASSGGYWVLGPYGAYLKVDPAMERADALSFTERIGRAFDNFRRFESVSEDFYREQRVLKMAAFPLLLLSLPTGYLMVFFVRQSGRSRRAWITLLLRVSAVYLALATIFIWWFWEMMGDF
jgi:hypothetical protein